MIDDYDDDDDDWCYSDEDEDGPHEDTMDVHIYMKDGGAQIVTRKYLSDDNEASKQLSKESQLVSKSDCKSAPCGVKSKPSRYAKPQSKSSKRRMKKRLSAATKAKTASGNVHCQLSTEQTVSTDNVSKLSCVQTNVKTTLSGDDISKSSSVGVKPSVDDLSDDFGSNGQG